MPQYTFEGQIRGSDGAIFYRNGWHYLTPRPMVAQDIYYPGHCFEPRGRVEVRLPHQYHKAIWSDVERLKNENANLRAAMSATLSSWSNERKEWEEKFEKAYALIAKLQRQLKNFAATEIYDGLTVGQWRDRALKAEQQTREDDDYIALLGSRLVNAREHVLRIRRECDKLEPTALDP